MPLSVQRAVSFLPINVDPQTKQSAQVSTEWRLELWRNALPEVSRYFFKGKGYALDPEELWSLVDVANRGASDSEAIMAYAGNYHNGALSVVIPFGIYGALAFLWFLVAGGWVLRQNYRHGDPALRTINAFLFAYFLARVFLFFIIFGEFDNDLFYFTGLLGLSISLNGGVARRDNETEPTAD
jgi:O-antigen ligase